MSLQLYEDKTKDAEHSGAMVLLPNGLQITEEEHEKRHRDAEELEEKLKFITEKVPTRIMNISGSNAGAGSGEFHMYRMARRREQMRLQRIDEQDKDDQADGEFRERKRRQHEQDEARAAKNRAQRQKKKQKQKGGKASGEVAECRRPQQEETQILPALD